MVAVREVLFPTDLSPESDRALVAREERADVIVMATRGHDSLADRVVGSNTERVVRHASCPVLVA